MLRRACLLVLLACAACAAASGDASRALLQNVPFPPYVCVHDMAISPFYIQAGYDVNAAGQICLTVRTKTPSASSRLCNRMDFSKLELNINPSCRQSITSFSVNGQKGPSPTYAVFNNNELLVKLTQVNLTTATADGAQICMTVTAPSSTCRNFDTLCPGGQCLYSIVKSGKCDCCPVGPLTLAPPPPSPSPPPPPTPPPFVPEVFNKPPPPPSPFPYCRCNTTANVTSFSLARTPVVTTGTTGQIYTFTVMSSTPFDPSNSCADTDLFKAEFWSSISCRRAVSKAYINGRAVLPQFDDKTGVFKIGSIGFSASAVPGPVGTIGFELKATGACPTLEKLCRSSSVCTYALFDASKLCCPVGMAGL